MLPGNCLLLYKQSSNQSEAQVTQANRQSFAQTMDPAEIPYCIGVFQMSLRMALLCMNKVREFNGVTDKEDRGIVTN